MRSGPVLALALLSACSGCKSEKAPSAAKDTPPPSPAAVHDAAPEAAVAPTIPKDLNVLLITIDCLRADMPWEGYKRPIAPRLTKLAEKAVVYTHEYSMSSYTSMSLGGMLGGKPPGELLRSGYFFGIYPRKNLFYPEILQKAGIHTVTAHAHGYFKTAGFDQGFDDYEMVPNLKWNAQTDENITSPQLEGIAEKQLGDPKNDNHRFFAWYHFLDPHDQYLPHEGIFYGNTYRDKYDAEVTFTNRYIGKLLDFVKSEPWGARTAIIVTADHGEAFGEHGMLRHGFQVWENLIRVPLLVVIPGIKPRRIDLPRSAVDIAPTLLDLFGLPPEPTFEGRSLLPELRGECDAGDDCGPRDVLVDLPATSDSDRRRALIHGHMKIIAFGESEYMQVFDLDADPGEEHPIVKGPEYQDMVKRYRARVKTMKDLEPYSCNKGCLNGAYSKPADAGAAGK